MTNLAHADTTHHAANPPPISALQLVETVTAVQVFTENGLDPLIERIEQEARSMALDISTSKGRKEVASLAAKIAKSKTALDKLGKDLVAGWKEQAKKVDTERSRALDRLEALQKEIRKPLTDWEEREKQRVANHEANIAEIAAAGAHIAANWQTLPLSEMNDRLTMVLTDKTDWQEFSARAKQAIDAASDVIAAAIIKRQKHDAEQAELARLRKEEEERKQRAHEERIAAEAAEKARLAAEAKAKRDAEAEAVRVRAEQEKAEKERQRIQREKEAAEAAARRAEEEKQEAIARAERQRIAAEEAAKRQKEQAEERARKAEQEKKDALAKAERERIAAAERAERDKIAAADKAKRDAELAAQRERDRIAAEKRAETEATAKREADQKHRERINGEALNAFTAAGLSLHDARHAVELIAQGHIPHITISY